MYNFKITLNHQKVILNQTVNTDVLFKNFTDQYLLLLLHQTLMKVGMLDSLNQIVLLEKGKSCF